MNHDDAFFQKLTVEIMLKSFEAKTLPLPFFSLQYMLYLVPEVGPKGRERCRGWMLPSPSIFNNAFDGKSIEHSLRAFLR